MWIKTKYLQDFINSGGITLPPDIFDKYAQDTDFSNTNRNLCPFCDNYHKKYVLLHAHPASIKINELKVKKNKESLTYYVCKDCCNVIQNEDPYIIEELTEQINEYPELENTFAYNKNKDPNLSIPALLPDYMDNVSSVYLKDFQKTCRLPSHVIDYTFNNEDKCIWCDSKEQLISVTLPHITTGIVMNKAKMCITCHDHYYEIIDRYLIANKSLKTESCVRCKSIYYVDGEESNKRYKSNQQNKHFCNDCLVEAGYENHPIVCDIKCPSCDTVHTSLYDLSLYGKLENVYCHACKTENNNLDELPIKYDDLDEEEGKSSSFNDKPAYQSYRKHIGNNIYLNVNFMTSNNKLHENRATYCYYDIEKLLDSEKQDELDGEMERLDSELIDNYHDFYELTSEYVKQTYGWVQILFTSYQSPNNKKYSLQGNEKDSHVVYQCVVDGLKKAQEILNNELNQKKLIL